ncbi:Uncharacterised protein [Mycobacteroides abscessus subsp. abscessus]|nr:Uncharacterised protein [Mycobacteroides abscessus subsp. abscessus]
MSVTEPGSIAVTRNIGTKILRRVSISTTRPITRGCFRATPMPITTSRTRPIDSPSGPRTTRPESLAANTLLTAAMTARLGGNRCGRPQVSRVGWLGAYSAVHQSDDGRRESLGVLYLAAS